MRKAFVDIQNCVSPLASSLDVHFDNMPPFATLGCVCDLVNEPILAFKLLVKTIACQTYIRLTFV